MIRRDVEPLEISNAEAGSGTVQKIGWFDDRELSPNLNMVATLVVPRGASIGDHMHVGEAEIYRMISGRALYNDNGKEVEVGPGDVLMCYDGQTHGIKAIGDEGFEFIAIIVKG